uniref:Putative secreted protein n=1 Tax=Anopheles darlingi TaxID=43151 RepID=A0A2M4DE00_ANODA
MFGCVMLLACSFLKKMAANLSRTLDPIKSAFLIRHRCLCARSGILASCPGMWTHRASLFATATDFRCTGRCFATAR